MLQLLNTTPPATTGQNENAPIVKDWRMKLLSAYMVLFFGINWRKNSE